MACLDTTFLVDLIREVRRRKTGPATNLLKKLLENGHSLTISLFTIAELYAGIQTHTGRERESLDEILALFEVLPFGTSTARILGVLYGSLRAQGREIGVIDTLIASVAIEYNEVLITQNIKHFSRIPGLVTKSYD